MLEKLNVIYTQEEYEDKKYFQNFLYMNKNYYPAKVKI